MLNFKYRTLSQEALSRALAKVLEVYNRVAIGYLCGCYSDDEALVILDYLSEKEKMIRYYIDKRHD